MDAGVCIEKLRSQILTDKSVQEGVSIVSANDIMCGILWLMRYPCPPTPHLHHPTPFCKMAGHCTFWLATQLVSQGFCTII